MPEIFTGFGIHLMQRDEFTRRCYEAQAEFSDEYLLNFRVHYAIIKLRNKDGNLQPLGKCPGFCDGFFENTFHIRILHVQSIGGNLMEIPDAQEFSGDGFQIVAAPVVISDGTSCAGEIDEVFCAAQAFGKIGYIFKGDSVYADVLYEGFQTRWESKVPIGRADDDHIRCRKFARGFICGRRQFFFHGKRAAFLFGSASQGKKIHIVKAVFNDFGFAVQAQVFVHKGAAQSVGTGNASVSGTGVDKQYFQKTASFRRKL